MHPNDLNKFHLIKNYLSSLIPLSKFAELRNNYTCSMEEFYAGTSYAFCWIH